MASVRTCTCRGQVIHSSFRGTSTHIQATPSTAHSILHSFAHPPSTHQSHNHPSTYRSFSSTPTQNATLLRRPQRPYTFTQLVTLSDGSTFTQRTTSPLPVLKSTKDTRNTPLWNPSSRKLQNVEEDEAGRLKAFRARFGRGWDADLRGRGEEGEDAETEGAVQGRRAVVEDGEERTVDGEEAGEEEGDSLMDLISGGYTQEAQISDGAEEKSKWKGKGKKK
ncbi:hypothetical protein MMC25_004823 [Agyrium rufum]|nr:hypothetical protein [Agyrium rufum]